MDALAAATPESVGTSASVCSRERGVEQVWREEGSQLLCASHVDLHVCHMSHMHMHVHVCHVHVM